MRKNFGRIIKNFKKSKKIQLSHKNNARDTNYFIKILQIVDMVSDYW